MRPGVVPPEPPLKTISGRSLAGYLDARKQALIDEGLFTMNPIYWFVCFGGCAAIVLLALFLFLWASCSKLRVKPPYSAHQDQQSRRPQNKSRMRLIDSHPTSLFGRTSFECLALLFLWRGAGGGGWGGHPASPAPRYRLSHQAAQHRLSTIKKHLDTKSIFIGHLVGDLFIRLGTDFWRKSFVLFCLSLTFFQCRTCRIHF